MLPDPSDPDRLEGWGQIAEFFKVDPKTVQRWERHRGLPVYRVLGDKGRPTIVAARSELAVWEQSRSHPAHSATDSVCPPETVQLRRIPGNRRLRLVIPSATALAIIMFLVVAATHGRRATSSQLAPSPDRILARAGAAKSNTRRLSVSASPINAVLSSEGRYLFVVHNGSGDLTIVDLDRWRVDRVIHFNETVTQVHAAQHERTAYVGTLAGLYSLDVETKQARRLYSSVGGVIRGFDITSEGSAYLAMEFDGLKRLDLGSGRVTTVDPAPDAHYVNFDPVHRQLFVSYQGLGYPNGGYDRVEVFQLPGDRHIGTLRGPPMVGGVVAIAPKRDVVVVDGLDACINPVYRSNVIHACPHWPTWLFHVFDSAGKLLKTIDIPVQEGGGLVTFTPDNSRAIIGGRPVLVYRTNTFDVVEQLDLGSSITRAVLDLTRRRVYGTAIDVNQIVAFDLPAKDCAPAASGIFHLWSADGTPNDTRRDIHFSFDSGARYVAGMIGQAFDLRQNGGVAHTLYNGLDAITFPNTSLMAWVLVTGPGSGDLVRQTRAGKPVFRIALEDRWLTMHFGPAVARTQHALTEGVWHHIAAVRRDNRVSLLVDGSLETELSATELLEGVPRTLEIGPAPAILDEVSTYVRPLSPLEIKAVADAKDQCLTGQIQD